MARTKNTVAPAIAPGSTSPVEPGAEAVAVKSAADPAAVPSSEPGGAPPDSSVGTLIAATVVNLAGRYYEPGAALDDEYVARMGDAAIAELIEAGAIRVG